MACASCMFAHFFYRIEHCWITKQQLGIPEDSGEAERSIRRETERHSGMIPNTIGA